MTILGICLVLDEKQPRRNVSSAAQVLSAKWLNRIAVLVHDLGFQTSLRSKLTPLMRLFQTVPRRLP